MTHLLFGELGRFFGERVGERVECGGFSSEPICGGSEGCYTVRIGRVAQG